jgi:hypothetical protein
VISVREIRDDDRPWLHELVARAWHHPVVSISGTYDSSTIPGYVAELDDDRVGALT